MKRVTRKTKERREMVMGILFSLPAIIGFFCFALGPMVASLILGFTEYTISSAPRFVGLDNYIRMFSGQDVFFYQALSVTLKFALMNVAVCMLTAFAVALLLNSEAVKCRGVVPLRILYPYHHSLRGYRDDFHVDDEPGFRAV